MSFYNRLFIFIVGMLLGVVIIFISLDMRSEPLSFDYFPNNRIKKYLINHELNISETAICKLECYDLDSLFLKQYISNSHVDFTLSKIRGYEVKTYYLSFNLGEQKNNQNIYFVFQKKDDLIVLVNLIGNDSMLNCAYCTASK
tara:strand:+ start:2174 stop:2602 length:429 start_codon:yes stop_codon:yes gene_type:complete